jgi:hypothetical protein
VGVPLLVEGSIAHRRRRGRWLDARRHWIVDVQVLRATFFSLTSCSCQTSVLGEDKARPIHVVREDIVTEEILADKLAFCMATDLNFLINTMTCRVQVLNCWPLTVMVNLEADGVTVLVIFLTGRVDAVSRTTLSEELFLRVVMQEDVNIAFDLLGC